MGRSDGLRSYTAPPVKARVMEQSISEPTSTESLVEKQLSFLRDEWRKAKTKAQRKAIEAEARELKQQASVRDNLHSSRDKLREDIAKGEATDHYDGCDGCWRCEPTPPARWVRR